MARAPRTPNPTESALYTRDLLISLRRLAEVHKQAQLVFLIDAAASEAETIARAPSANAG
jgi:hypothetical protein